METPTVVGLSPWLPWPLCRWAWWTEPVRAERLAVLRIAVSALLLIDLLTTYLPNCSDYFGRYSLGDPDVFAYWSRAPRWHWSLLHGLSDPLISSLALAGGIVSFVYLLCTLAARREAGETSLLRWATAAWAIAAPAVVLGQWGRITAESGGNLVQLLGPATAWGATTLLLMLNFWRRGKNDSEGADPWIGRGLVIAWVGTGILFAFGLWRWWQGAENPTWLRGLLGRWDADADILRVLLLAWLAATVLLCVGLWTRASAVVVWVLSTSFATLNPYIDNAGDSVRGIALFYLMLGPCGAAWSVDRWWTRRRGQPERPVFIHPWVLRLLFLQMVFIYFCNGVYKVTGSDWRAGNSLYYVLNDVVLSRFSYVQFPVPVWMTRVMSWTVLGWEVLFPLLVACRWTRAVTLVLGVAFHLGILVSMELGFFAPYMIALYLPLLPWERWTRT